MLRPIAATATMPPLSGSARDGGQPFAAAVNPVEGRMNVRGSRNDSTVSLASMGGLASSSEDGQAASYRQDSPSEGGSRDVPCSTAPTSAAACMAHAAPAQAATHAVGRQPRVFIDATSTSRADASPASHAAAALWGSASPSGRGQEGGSGHLLAALSAAPAGAAAGSWAQEDYNYKQQVRRWPWVLSSLSTCPTPAEPSDKTRVPRRMQSTSHE